MPAAHVRRAVTAAALTAVFILPSVFAQAMADVGDKDIVRLQLTGVAAGDTSPWSIDAGDSWVTFLELYDKKKRFAGDASARCSALEATHERVTVQCTRVLRLKKGTLTLSDMITRVDSSPVTAKTAIAGGTGIYNDAEGEGYVTLDFDRVHFDLHVDD